VRLKNDTRHIDRYGAMKREAMRVQMAVVNAPMNEKIVSSFVKFMKNQVEHKKLTMRVDPAKIKQDLELKKKQMRE